MMTFLTIFLEIFKILLYHIRFFKVNVVDMLGVVVKPQSPAICQKFHLHFAIGPVRQFIFHFIVNFFVKSVEEFLLQENLLKPTISNCFQSATFFVISAHFETKELRY